MATTINLEGTYKLNDDLLENENNKLKLGLRHRPKKGQAKRFIGYISPDKPEDEQYTYISSLYTKQGTTKFSLEFHKQMYELSMTGVNKVVIKKANKEPVLVYQDPEGKGK